MVLKTNEKRHNVRANSDFIPKLQRVLEGASSALISLRLESDVWSLFWMRFCKKKHIKLELGFKKTDLSYQCSI